MERIRKDERRNPTIRIIMDYLFQFIINAPDVTHEKVIEMDFRNLKLKLFLHDINLISKGKKLHLIINASKKEEAYNLAWRDLGDFNNRLIFLVDEDIVISHMEFIMEDQSGESIRKILFRDINLPGMHSLNIHRFNHYSGFFQTNLAGEDFDAIRYFNDALRSDSLTEKFRSLYLSLESLVGNEQVEVTCDKCEEKLICPKCKSPKIYPRVTKKRIDSFLQSQEIYTFEVPNRLNADILVKLRAALSHARHGRWPKSAPDLTDTVHHLSLFLRWYLEKKYEIDWPGSSVIKYGSVATIEREYRTDFPQDKFALDIPPVDELKNHREDSRWIYSN